MRVEEGQAAPALTLPRDGGGTISLADLRGGPVVIFVYSEAGTPTCTEAARTFSERRAEFDALGATVLGLSPDPVAKQDKFREKHALTVPLLADEAHDLIEGWGIWVEKQMFGNRYMGVERTTYLIDGNGTVRRIWRKVRQKGHVDAVLDAIRAL